MNMLILGGTGGIGSALIKHVLKQPNVTKVYATFHTQPPSLTDPRLQWFKVDITQEAAIAHLAEHIPSLTFLINTIGILHTKEAQPEKSLKSFESEFFKHNINTNALPSILLAKYFSCHLRQDQQTYFISFSAKIGSITDNHLGGWISYRASKAALNMALKTISIEWRHQLPQCTVIAFHPGTTETSLSQPFQKNVPRQKLFTPDYVAQCLTDLIQRLKPQDTGTFFSYTGRPIPW
ncbi:SDR family NAD(P)-dependent oxidoreductase [uncultured Shewanella sp.]|uniref:SDR family NAD(P)-dependent oxidoreductase n=1 Tax=uncultured Shewanella sp. TaxID=173975 RepID=UPI00261DEC9C|nr:SDR family NAD(P)-dependent oxidoreductase [uncultured Shewanella sp.]